MIQKDELLARKRISEAMDRLEPEVRERVMARISDKYNPRHLIGSIEAEMADCAMELREQENAVAKSKERIAAVTSIKPWSVLEEYVLERNDCSRLHKLQEALRAGNVIRFNETLAAPDVEGVMDCWFTNTHAFVVEHDWASAFKNATDYEDGPVVLPFDTCAFEFRISGKSVVVFVAQPESYDRGPFDVAFDGPHFAMPYVQCINGFWFCGGVVSAKTPLMTFVWKQVRAICIALDAEVAVHEVTRAPAALNEKREKKGEPLLHDFHVVKLHGRIAHSGGAHGGTHRSPRLHFRRGHWRHFETHKTWIRWMLVGDPELGFIDKSYRL